MGFERMMMGLVGSDSAPAPDPAALQNDLAEVEAVAPPSTEPSALDLDRPASPADELSSLQTEVAAVRGAPRTSHRRAKPVPAQNVLGDVLLEISSEDTSDGRRHLARAAQSPDESDDAEATDADPMSIEDEGEAAVEPAMPPATAAAAPAPAAPPVALVAPRRAAAAAAGADAETQAAVYNVTSALHPAQATSLSEEVSIAEQQSLLSKQGFLGKVAEGAAEPIENSLEALARLPGELEAPFQAFHHSNTVAQGALR